MERLAKRDAMRRIRDEIVGLAASPLFVYRTRNRYHPVIGEGNHDADVVFIGEAPGRNEAEQGRPFCGAAGDVLDAVLAEAGLKREDVYITNVVKDRPPDNRDPLPEEIALYGPYLDRQLAIIQPKIIVSLGRFSMRYLADTLGCAEQISSISAAHGRPIRAQAPYGAVAFLPLFHPAMALYTASVRETLLRDARVIPALRKRARGSL